MLLPAFALGAGPVIMAIQYAMLMNLGPWLTKAAGDGRFWAIVGIDLARFAFCIFVAIRFYARRRSARPLFQVLLVSNVLGAFATAIITGWMYEAEPPVADVVKALIYATIFIPAMAISKRAKATFTK